MNSTKTHPDACLPPSVANQSYLVFLDYFCAIFVLDIVFVQCGADVNRSNSYEQTALEVVNKFTASRGARDIKQMLRGESVVVA